MKIELGKATNKGTALLKLAHQFQSEVLFRDEYVRWFFEEDLVQSLQEHPLDFDADPQNEVERFQQIAYWYVILRERHGDEAIVSAIASGCQQLLLLGSGYDTRFFRLPEIRDHLIFTFEVDLPKTIEDKSRYLLKQLGKIPHALKLIPLDFTQDRLESIQKHGFDPAIPTAYIWQGVSYYLSQENISNFLDFIKANMASGSVFVFDCCSPLMTFKNHQIPGIASQIDRLQEIGEPYQFGLLGSEMVAWLKEKGFKNIQILQQDDLEEKFLNRQTLPNNMWYVVTVQA